MKVTIVDQTGGKIGGAQQSLELFIRHRPADVDPTVVFFEDGAFADRIRALGVKTVVASMEENLRALTRDRLPMRGLRALPAIVRTLTMAIRETVPDVVYTNGVKAHVLGSIVARTLGVPSVVHHRDILTGPIRWAFLAVIAAASRARIATSLNVVRAYPLPRTTVIDNPVDLNTFRDLPDRAASRAFLGFDDSVPIAGIVGRINRWKGLDRFLRALAIANESCDLRGLIVGAPHFRDADLLDELRILRSTLGLDDRVRFVDWVDDARTIYAAIEINVNASDREPFGRTIIEAAAAGVPSICFDDSGVSETMSNGKMGLVLPAGDEKAMARALVSYAADREAREAAGRAAFEWSRRFDAALHAEHVAGVLRAAARQTKI